MPTPNEREMLLAVHHASDVFAGGVPRRTFRAAQHEELEVLDRLVRQGDIREQGERYAVELLTLCELDDEDAKVLIADCETVFDALRKRYVDAQDSLMLLGQFASATGLPEERALRALAYLNTFHAVIGARTGSSLSDPSGSIAPADQILNTRSFADVLKLLQGYRDARSSMSGSYAVTPAFIRPSTMAPIHQASWLRELPGGLAELLQEVIEAKANGLRRLTAMGIRTAIDMWADDVAGRDLKNFGAKLDELELQGCIAKAQRAHLDAVYPSGKVILNRQSPATRMLST